MQHGPISQLHRKHALTRRSRPENHERHGGPHEISPKANSMPPQHFSPCRKVKTVGATPAAQVFQSVTSIICALAAEKQSSASRTSTQYSQENLMTPHPKREHHRDPSNA